ncbi:MAG: class I SAM-dependent methyltransferase [Cyanobacteriota bacterium]|jgi:SAM-dependent methyltransferase
MRIPANRQISTQRLIDLYQDVGIDVSRFFADIERLTLEEQVTGLLCWSPIVVGDSDFYAQLSTKIPHYYPHDKPEFKVALDLLPPGSEVLEVGCGEGRFGTLLASDKWLGVDINEKAIQKGKTKGLRCCVWNFLQDDIDALPQQKFPFICSFQMIEHLPDPGRLFTFAYQHLSPDGRLIVGAPAMDSLLGKNPMSILNLPPHHQTWWTDRALRLYPEQFGFICEDLIHVPLDFAHHRAYLSTLLRDLLAKRVSHLPPFLSGWINNLSSKPIALLTRLLMKEGSIDPIFGARGQSVVAVYRKATPAAFPVSAANGET